MTLSALAAAAAAVLGYALQLSSGSFQYDAIIALSVTIALALAAVVLPPGPASSRGYDWVPISVIAAGLGMQFFFLLRDEPGFYLQATPADLQWFDRGVWVAAGLAAATFVSVRWTKRVVFPLLLVVHALLGAWMLRASPDVSIDVIHFHAEAFAALDRGENPHEQTIPNIYARANNYGEGLVRDQRVLVGHPYPPLSLGLTYLAHKLTGDYRILMVLAMPIAAALIGYARGTRISFGAAALFLFTPRAFFVLQQGWTEPLAACLFALTVFVAIRRPGWLWPVLGALLAIKQYMVLVLPVVAFLRPDWRAGDAGRAVVKAAFLAALITAPLFLWNPAAFINDVVLFQLKQPFRTDALSYLAWIFKGTGVQVSAWLGLAAGAVAALFALWRAPRTPAGFAAASALIVLAVVAFNKQAFCNYYYFAVALLASASAHRS